MEHEPKTLDEVVAANLKRLRDQVTVKDLADRLGLGVTAVYDMEGGRTDRPQRRFSWEEVVGICAALSVNLLDLVMPDDGQSVVADWPPVQGEPAMTWSRDDLSRALFGSPITAAELEAMSATSDTRRKRQERIRRELVQLIEQMEDEDGDG